MVLELTRECQSTSDERLVDEGFAVPHYPCPLCGDIPNVWHKVDKEGPLAVFQRSSDRRGPFKRIAPHDWVPIFECCFVLCHDEPVVREDACEFCAECEEHCECDHCDHCGNVAESVCSNCANCEVHCHCTTCHWCEEPSDDTTTVGYYEYCEVCLSDHFSYCDYCEEWFDDDDSDHSHDDCDCEPRLPHFEFPADGAGTVSENERLTVELPKGTIDDEGLDRITRMVQEAVGGGLRWNQMPREQLDQFRAVPDIITEVGPLWQAKRGNFTRRLSSALHKRGIKLTDGLISEVGNVARQHSSDTAVWHVEFTRDLNESAEHFYHEDSCWWPSYGGNRPESATTSRCCLKNWGGLAIRTFASESRGSYYSRYNEPTGRAWIQPLNADLEPTHDAIGAAAYLIFNGYGDLEGYVAARIVAHLASKSYRKVAFGAYNVYINGDQGYLVADEAICANTESIRLNHGEHESFDANTLRRAA